tara:strand:+ start:962 stop:2212 length:1251 start_codon:yes stop_codon:yes gene_type:complete
MNYKKTAEFASQLDKQDQLSSYRDEFFIPKDENGNELIYLCGNSLGLQPKRTKAYLNQELEDWAKLGVEGHEHAKNPWMPYHEFLSESYSKIVGGKKSEVVAMNSLTVNLHLMMVSFYRPNIKRNKILIEADAFPSDIYAVNSQISHHGYEPKDTLIKLSSREGESVVRTEDIEQVIREKGDEIALIMLGGVNYYTGQVFDFETITKLAHDKGILVGFDLAHAAGNIKLELHKWNVDFAVWCSYKYLNSGPGSLAGAFIHEKHHKSSLPRFAGWWGHNKENRFKMPDEFEPIQTAEGWQQSNPPILSLAAIRASLSIFDEIGMDALVTKSKKMTDYLIWLLKTIETNKVNIITPKEKGCQISIQVKNADKKIFKIITKKGVIADWREPDVIRIAPVPLYNSYTDVYKFYKILDSVL